jgi:hypothetical protein
MEDCMFHIQHVIVESGNLSYYSILYFTNESKFHLTRNLFNLVNIYKILCVGQRREAVLPKNPPAVVAVLDEKANRKRVTMMQLN